MLIVYTYCFILHPHNSIISGCHDCAAVTDGKTEAYKKSSLIPRLTIAIQMCICQLLLQPDISVLSEEKLQEGSVVVCLFVCDTNPVFFLRQRYAQNESQINTCHTVAFMVLSLSRSSGRK